MRAAGAAAADYGGTSTWIATALQSSSVQLLKYAQPPSRPFFFATICCMYTRTGGSPRRPSHELQDGISVLGLLNDHMLRAHTQAAIGEAGDVYRIRHSTTILLQFLSHSRPQTSSAPAATFSRARSHACSPNKRPTLYPIYCEATRARFPPFFPVNI